MKPHSKLLALSALGNVFTIGWANSWKRRARDLEQANVALIDECRKLSNDLYVQSNEVAVLRKDNSRLRQEIETLRSATPPAAR